jgi:hypothetical protein
MNDDYTGGPAYPCLDTDLTGLHLRHSGKTLRDDFAGTALSALILDSLMRGVPPRGLAAQAYVLADAMIEAREILPGGFS